MTYWQTYKTTAKDVWGRSMWYLALTLFVVGPTYTPIGNYLTGTADASFFPLWAYILWIVFMPFILIGYITLERRRPYE